MIQKNRLWQSFWALFTIFFLSLGAMALEEGRCVGFFVTATEADTFAALLDKKLVDFPVEIKKVILDFYNSAETSEKLKRILYKNFARKDVQIVSFGPNHTSVLDVPYTAIATLENFNTAYAIGDIETQFANAEVSPPSFYTYVISLDKNFEKYKVFLSLMNMFGRIEMTDALIKYIKSIRFPLTVRSEVAGKDLVIDQHLIVWSHKFQRMVIDRQLQKLLSDRAGLEMEAEAYMALPKDFVLPTFMTNLRPDNYRMRIVQNLMFETGTDIVNPQVRRLALCSLADIFSAFASTPVKP